MRIRHTKPEFWKSEVLAEVGRDVRLTYLGLWNLADGWGLMEDRPRRIKAELFPYDSDVTAETINGWLNELMRIGKVMRYMVDGESFLFIPSLRKHQIHGMPKEERKRPPRFPAPPNIAIDDIDQGGARVARQGGDGSADDPAADDAPPSYQGGDSEENQGGATLVDEEIEGHGGKIAPDDARNVARVARQGGTNVGATLTPQLNTEYGRLGGGGARARVDVGEPPPPPDGSQGSPAAGGEGEPPPNADPLPDRLAPLVAAGVDLDAGTKTRTEWIRDTRGLPPATVESILAGAEAIPIWPSDFRPLRDAYLALIRAEQRDLEAAEEAKRRAQERFAAEAERLAMEREIEPLEAAARQHALALVKTILRRVQENPDLVAGADEFDRRSLDRLAKAFKSDRVSGIDLGRIVERFPALREAVEDPSRKWTEARTVLIERHALSAVGGGAAS